MRAALASTGLTDRSDQPWHHAFRRERQRLQIARAPAQEPRELLNLVAELPVTSVVALHNLNLAAMYCDQLVVFREGRVVAVGSPADTLTETLIADVYGARAEVTHPGPDDHPHIRFLGTVSGT